MTHPAQPWFESARRSLDAAAILHAAKRWPQACFHAQQSVELALKAGLARENSAPPRLHSIAELFARQDVNIRRALDHLADDLRDLDKYYMGTRYPDAMLESLPTESDADEALAAAKEGMTIIRNVLDAAP
ncbi:MAG: HEPN domain-containing protein [Chloroflexota bacterium]|nr:HEPN domain-containing protein [Chloroflexota bacterium]